ncbi:MAG: glycerophosphodiester phosphodiesterase [Chitinophagaceae bacterium]|nr:glycerophosphodiester phosphodiesterase [Chitinophagaceae bacterium]
MKRAGEYIELLIVLVIVIGCHAVKNTQVVIPTFDKHGHRGARGLLPENTIPGMLKAIDLGVTTLEMDAVITADGKLILSHEPFFHHDISSKPNGEPVSATEEKSLNIYKMDFAATQQYDVGLRGNPRFLRQEKIKAVKPLLSNVISEVEKYARNKYSRSLFYSIETKSNPATDNIYHPAPEVYVDQLMAVVIKQKVDNRTIIQSFDFRTLQVLHRKYPAVQTSALVEPFDKRSLNDHIISLGFTPSIYSPNYVLVTPALVDSCHARGMRIIPWTVNDAVMISKLKLMKVDGIISDYPDLFE